MKKVYLLNQLEVDIIESCLAEIKYRLKQVEQNYFTSCALDAVNELYNVLTIKEITHDNN